MNRVKLSKTPFVCPVCGESLLPAAKSCPECGSCERSGWNTDAVPDGLDLPDDEDDYKRIVSREFGTAPQKSFKDQLWWVIALIVLIATAMRLIYG